jgi:hypothetical protein
MSSFDFEEMLKLVMKYLIEGLVVAFVAFVFPKKKLDLEEVVIVALTAASTFAVLDVFLGNSNPITQGTKSGLGMAIGSGLAGGFKFAAPVM